MMNVKNLILCLVTLMSGTLLAQDGTWIKAGTGLDFFDPANWEDGSAPTNSNSTLRFAQNGAAEIKLTNSFRLISIERKNPSPVTLRFVSGTQLSSTYVTGTEPLTLAGAGGLPFSHAENFSGYVKLTENTFLGFNGGQVVANVLPVTTGLLFHVDASAPGTLETNGGVVNRWTDADGGSIYATAAGEQKPTVISNALNGLPVVDMGPASGDAGMAWSEALDTIRTYFLVIGSQEGGGCLLGTKEDTPNFKAERGMDLHASKGAIPFKKFVFPYTIDHALFAPSADIANVYLNSFCISDANGAFVCGLSGKYDLVTVRTARNSTSSAFARRAGLSAQERMGREGGQRLAEAVFYNYVLSEYERSCVEAYLMRKWFGKWRLGYGPAFMEKVEVATDNNLFNDQIGANGPSGNIARVGTLVLSNSVGTSYFSLSNEKRIETTRLVADRNVRLMGGRLSMTARRTSRTCPATDAAIHADATVGLTFNSDGSIARWAHACGGAEYVAQDRTYSSPTCVSNVLNGLPVVDFGSTGSHKHLAWSTNRVARSVFFVMKVTNKLNSFLGSTCPAMGVVDHFTRYTGEGNIWSPIVQGGARSGLCHLDGVSILQPWETVLGTNEFHLLAHVFDAGALANAFGCGAYMGNNNPRAERTGGLQIAEALIFDRKLTEDESLDIQAYLMWKWFGKTLDGYAPPDQPYVFAGVGSGSDTSVLQINGTVPVRVNSAFGNQCLTLQAPDTVVTWPEVTTSGRLLLDCATVASSCGRLCPLVIPQESTGGVFVAKDQTVTAESVRTLGVLQKKGPGTLVMSAAPDSTGSFEIQDGALVLPQAGIPGAQELRGTGTVTGGMLSVVAVSPGEKVASTGTLSVEKLTLRDGFSMNFDIETNSSFDKVDVGALTVEGGGTCRVSFGGGCVNPFGQYTLLSFTSVSGLEHLAGWTVDVSNLSKKYTCLLRPVGNSLVLTVSSRGCAVMLR